MRSPHILSLVTILGKIICLLVAIAYYTLAERKIRAAIQRRRGPNVVGIYGLLQPLADGLKLIAKERIIPSQSNSRIFVLAPLIVLTLGLLGWSVIPFGCHDHSEQASNYARINTVCKTAFSTPNTLTCEARIPGAGLFLKEANTSLTYKYTVEANPVADIRYGRLFLLTISSRNVYGLIISGWASNSKYAFLGALRSSAQRIAYEVSISLVVAHFLVVGGALNFTEIVDRQNQTVSNIRELFPRSNIYFISSIAETNRTPFDLPEAEAELVAGYNVDFSSIIFARFFLAEYGNRILRSIQNALSFLGAVLAGLIKMDKGIRLSSIVLSIKTLVFCFIFVLVRATFPRYRYDQLRDLGWKTFLPVTTAFFLFATGIVVFYKSGPVVHELRPSDYSEAKIFRLLGSWKKESSLLKQTQIRCAELFVSLKIIINRSFPKFLCFVPVTNEWVHTNADVSAAMNGLIAIVFHLSGVINAVGPSANLNNWLSFTFFLYAIGLIGRVMNPNTFVIRRRAIEIMYLGVITSFVLYGVARNDPRGYIYGLLLIILAACESAVGLGIRIVLHRFGDSVQFSDYEELGG